MAHPLHGADPNHSDGNGNTALHIAALFNMEDVIELLLKHGAEPEKKNLEEMTALHIASMEGHIQCVKRLHYKSYSSPMINSKNDKDVSPLDLAVVCGQYEVVEYLLITGDVQTHLNRALCLASFGGYLFSLRNYFKGHKMNRRSSKEDKFGLKATNMYKLKSFLNTVDCIHHTYEDQFLYFAPEICYVNIIKLLCDVKFDECCKSYALVEACASGRPQIVKCLIETSREINFGNALTTAAVSGNIEYLKLLLNPVNVCQ